MLRVSCAVAATFSVPVEPGSPVSDVTNFRKDTIEIMQFLASNVFLDKLDSCFHAVFT
jgi:hypothetical protein